MNNNFMWYESYTETADGLEMCGLGHLRNEFIIGLIDYGSKGIAPTWEEPVLHLLFANIKHTIDKSVSSSRGGQKSRKPKAE